MIRTYLLITSISLAFSGALLAQQSKPPQAGPSPVKAKVLPTKKVKLAEAKVFATLQEASESTTADSNKALQTAAAQKAAKRLKISQPNTSSSK